MSDVFRKVGFAGCFNPFFIRSFFPTSSISPCWKAYLLEFQSLLHQVILSNLKKRAHRTKNLPRVSIPSSSGHSFQRRVRHRKWGKIGAFQSLLHQVILSNEFDKGWGTFVLYAEVSIPSSSGHSFQQMVRPPEPSPAPFVSIPSSSGHSFQLTHPWGAGSGATEVSIPSSSGHSFQRLREIIENINLVRFQSLLHQVILSNRALPGAR